MKKIRFLIFCLFTVLVFGIVGYNIRILMESYNLMPSFLRIENDRPKQDVVNKTQDKEPITISFVGDVLLGGNIESIINKIGTKNIMSGVKDTFNESDINMANLENPITTRGIREKDKQYTFRAKPHSIRVLTDAGINMITLANNHILDFGLDGLVDTMKYADDNKISYVGAGTDLDVASEAVYIDKKDYKIAFLGSSRVVPSISWYASNNKPGVSETYNPKRLLEEIKEAKNKADIVVAYIHWGEEMKEFPVEYQRNLAKSYIDAGCDIVVGWHPHILQGIEFYKNRIIAYSLGNFVFTNALRDSMILKVEIAKDGLKTVRIVPVVIKDCLPFIVTKKEKYAEVMESIRKISFDVDIDSDGFVKDMKR